MAFSFKRVKEREVMLISYIYFPYIKRSRIINQRTKQENLEECIKWLNKAKCRGSFIRLSFLLCFALSVQRWLWGGCIKGLAQVVLILHRTNKCPDPHSTTI